MRKVLFVCLGNICRSPMAEGLLRKALNDQGETKILVDSAATSQWEIGHPPHKGTQKVLSEWGVDFQSMRAREITTADFLEADWIIGMDHQNVRDLLDRAPNSAKDKIHLFMETVPFKTEKEVPDPYYTGDFNETKQLIVEGLKYWIPIFLKT